MMGAVVVNLKSKIWDYYNIFLMEKKGNGRNLKLDSLKVFLIIVVILGHVIGNDNFDVVNKCCRTFIYSFHMPLFILLSGYFTKIKNNNYIFWKDILKIGLPLCIFQGINILLIVLNGGTVGKIMLFIPYWTLWYLLSLIFWKIILQYSPNRLLNSPFLYLFIAIIVSIFSGLMPYGRILSIQRTFNFFPFYLMGFYLQNREFIIPRFRMDKMLYIGMISIIMILIIFDLYPQKQSILLRGADNYGLYDIPSKIYLLLCAFILTIAFYKLSKENRFLAYIGQNSLFYYLYHGLIIEYILYPIIDYLGFPQSFLFMILYTLFIIGVICLLSKMKLFRIIINPIA